MVVVLAPVLALHTAAAQERMFTLAIPEGQLNYIGKILGKQPYEDSAGVLNSIQTQVNAQLAREANAREQAERDRIRRELNPAPAPAEEPRQ